MKKTIILIVLAIIIIIVCISCYYFFIYHKTGLYETATANFSSDLEIAGQTNSWTYDYYKNIKSKELCDEFGGDWNTKSGAWQKIEACYVKDSYQKN